MTIISIFMSSDKTSATQRKNAYAQQRILSRKYPWALWERFQSTNRNFKYCKIEFQKLNNWKGVLQISPLILSEYIQTRSKAGMKTMRMKIFIKIITTKVKFIKVWRKKWANKSKMRENKLKHVRPIKQARLCPTIHHHSSNGWMNIPPIILNIWQQIIMNTPTVLGCNLLRCRLYLNLWMGVTYLH